MTPSDNPREGFMPPWPDWQGRTPQELADRLRTDTFEVEPGSPEERAAMGLAIAVGNYEWLLDKPSTVIMDAAGERIDALGGDRSKYWG